MKISRGRKREPGLKSTDLIRTEPEQTVFPPEAVLSPDLIKDIISVRRALEIEHMIGNRVTSAIQFGSLVKMTIPEKIDWPPEHKNLL